jgi:hypothetical protein
MSAHSLDLKLELTGRVDSEISFKELNAFYSTFSAMTGSTRDARQAGPNAAARLLVDHSRFAQDEFDGGVAVIDGFRMLPSEDLAMLGLLKREYELVYLESERFGS